MLRNVLIASLVVFTLACSDDSTTLSENGGSCEKDNDCTSALCEQQLSDDFVFPGGLCTNECDIDAAVGETGCTLSEVCLIHNATGATFCYQRCNSDDDCREEWLCLNIGFFSPTLVCLPNL